VGETRGRRGPETSQSIANIAAKLENDQWETVRKVAQAHWLAETIHVTLHNDLKLSKEVSDVVIQTGGQGDDEEERVRACKAFIGIIATVPWPSSTMFSL
jgi:hypothetical protein